MRPPVQYNTYVQSKDRFYIDKLSKGYLICEMMLGLNRLPIFGNVSLIYMLLALAYSAFIQTVVILYMMLFHKVSVSYTFAVFGPVVKHGFIVIYCFISWKRIQLYYCELNKFDTKTGCRPYTPKGSIKSFVLLVVISLLLALLYLLSYVVPRMRKYVMVMLLMHVIDLFEIHYFGHLINLLILRMQLINRFMELSLSNAQDTADLNIKEFKLLKTNVAKSNCGMKKLMDLYRTIIKAYDFLMEAIKWQLLLILISTFITVLNLAYQCSYNVLRNQSLLETFTIDLALGLVLIMRFFSICFFGDRLHVEVRRLRQLLAFRFYENKLDKSSRRIARALLAFTETRNLTFKLLRMLNMGISLPFEMVGLVVTHLIIFLQFEKIINP